MSDRAIVLRVDGVVENPLALSFDDLAAFPEADRVPDVSQFQPGRQGEGVTFEALLNRCRPKPEATHVTLHAGRDDFHVSISLDALRGQGVVVFRLDGGPLPPDRGGPLRFLIRDPAACHTGELDDCANVKYLDRIELTIRRGRDTRPVDESAHAALHAREAENSA